MGIDLEKTSASFRARLQVPAEAARARRDYHADHPVPAAVGSQPAPALERGRARERAGAGGGGRRYRVEFTLHCCNPYDWDNAASAIKAVQDALVTEGWLPGDGWRELEGSAKAVKVAHKNQQKTVAILTRLA